MIELLEDLHFKQYDYPAFIDDTESNISINISNMIDKNYTDGYTHAISVCYVEYDNKDYYYDNDEFNAYIIKLENILYKYIGKVYESDDSLKVHIFDPYAFKQTYKSITFIADSNIDDTIKKINSNKHKDQDELNIECINEEDMEKLYLVFESSNINVINNIKILAR